MKIPSEDTALPCLQRGSYYKNIILYPRNSLMVSSGSVIIGLPMPTRSAEPSFRKSSASFFVRIPPVSRTGMRTDSLIFLLASANQPG
jgi:hypothetical protein